MPRVLPRVCWLWLSASVAAMAGTFTIGPHHFTLPDGFEIEQVAGPPAIEHPIAAAFDEAGRLYVTEASGSSAKADVQAKELPNRVVRFEAPDANGHFTKRTVFAEKLPFLEGIMWRDGSLYVGAPPSIWKLTDTDGDGVADQRSEWYQGKTVTGCGNDIHGPFAGPDGWIYWCKGAFAEQTHEVQGGRRLTDRASHIFRCRPDGTGLESIMTGGMDNPVGLAFTREGEPIFSATFLDLSGDGKRDGLAHAIYGGVFGKENAVVEDRAVLRTGPLLPAMTHFGAGAPCGLIRYESGRIGEEYRDNFFTCLFNLHKVTRHVLEPSGSTYATKDHDFLVSDSLDFHPTDVIEDADGSLLLVDTGGWYKVCCPTSQLAKPDVPGAIYRVRKKGAAPLKDPRGLKIEWAQLDAPAVVALLDDARPVVAARATAEVARRGREGSEALAAGFVAAETRVRVRFLWSAAQLNAEAPLGMIRSALNDGDPVVQQTAVKVLGLLRDGGARLLLEKALGGPMPLRRAAVEALGRLPENPELPPIQWALLRAGEGHADDPFLAHSLVYSLIELGDPGAIALENLSLAMKRLAGTAIAELNEDAFDLQKMGFGRRSFSETGTLDWFAGLVARHPVWAPELAELLGDELSRDRSAVDRGRLEQLFARLLQNSALQQGILTLLENDNLSTRASALRAMSMATLKKAPPEWFDACARLLAGAPELRAPAVALARSLSRQPESARLVPPLRAVAASAETPELLLAALAAMPAGALTLDGPLFQRVLASVRPEVPLSDRLTALEILSRATLADPARGALAEIVPQLGPLELMRLLPAFDRPLPDAVGQKVLTALEKAPALASCPPQALREVFAKQPAAVQPQCQAILAKLNLDPAQQRAKLDAIAAELPAGEVRRGQAVFAKAGCIVCHPMGYLGGKFGPDLTNIGTARSERDLLEAIVFPSASFVRSYEPYTAKLKSGGEVIGLLRSETADTIVLATAPGAEQRLARAEVEALQPGATSLMPQGFDRVLSRQELADLVSFLKGAPKPK